MPFSWKSITRLLLTMIVIAVMSSLGMAEVSEPADMQELIDALRSEDADIREQAVKALGKLGPGAEGAVPQLIEILKHDRYSVRSSAAEALGRIGEAALPDLMALLSSESSAMRSIIRYRAAVALGKIGKPAVPALCELLGNKNSELRQAAVEALGKIGPEAEEAVPLLTALLKDERAWEVRLAAAEALGKIGKSSIGALIEGLKDQHNSVKISAAEGLGELGPGAQEAVPLLTALLKDERAWEVRLAAAESLGKIGKSSIGALIEALKDKHNSVRSSAAEGLGELGPDAQKAVPALLRAFEDKNVGVRRSAADALDEIGADPITKTYLVGDIVEWSGDEKAFDDILGLIRKTVKTQWNWLPEGDHKTSIDFDRVKNTLVIHHCFSIHASVTAILDLLRLLPPPNESAWHLNFQLGPIQRTGRPFDIAIHGPGFLQIDDGSGNELFTRTGKLTLNSSGQIVLARNSRLAYFENEGMPYHSQVLIQPPVTIPPDAMSVEITADGQVFIYQLDRPYPQQVGQIDAVRFQNPAGLEQVDVDLFAETEVSGPTDVGVWTQDGFGMIRQGCLETQPVASLAPLYWPTRQVLPYVERSHVIQDHASGPEKFSLDPIPSHKVHYHYVPTHVPTRYYVPKTPYYVPKTPYYMPLVSNPVAGSQEKKTTWHLNFELGPIRETGRPLDIAIYGLGFLRIDDGYGNDLFTRAGKLTLNEDGHIVLPGYIHQQGETKMDVQPPITIPPDAKHIYISRDGQVYVTKAGNPCLQKVGQLDAARFQNPGGLDRIDNNLFGETSESGPPDHGVWTQDGFGSIKQGFLETLPICSKKGFESEIRQVYPYIEDEKIELVSLEVAEGFEENAKQTTWHLNFELGPIRKTGRPLDIAIYGPGFLRLDDGQGDDLYTRSGHLDLDASGHLILTLQDESYVVQPPVTISIDAKQIYISSDGQVYVTQAGNPSPKQVGQLDAVRFQNPGGLDRIDNNLFRETSESGPPDIGVWTQDGFGSIKQGFLETIPIRLTTPAIPQPQQSDSHTQQSAN